MADLKTRPEPGAPEDYIATLTPERRRVDGMRALALMREVTGDPAVMWGPSMIGFGTFHYKYASGREGDTMRIGFSPRAAALTFYGLLGHPRTEELLTRLGPHTLGKGCLYVKRWDAVDEAVLRELVEHAYAGTSPAGDAR